MNKRIALKLCLFFLSFNIVLSLLFSSRLGFNLLLNKAGFNVLGESTDNHYINNQTGNIIQSSFLTAGYKDYRAFVLDKYFEKYGSPLKGYGSDFITACDKYGLSEDCTVIPAIAFVETGLCTLGISAKQFNCWGFGGSDTNRIIYKNFSESIDTVTRRLAVGYSTSLFDPAIMSHDYCGPDCNKWAKGVNDQRVAIKKMAYNDYNLPPFK